MKLSLDTQKILSNFASINPGMLFEEGNVQHTISPLNTIVCQTTLTESFPQNFAIYDLESFLKFYKSIDDAELEFHKEYVIIKNKVGEELIYYFAEPEMIVAPKKKPYDHPESTVRFFVETKTFQKIRSLSTYSSFFKYLKIWSKNKKIVLSLTNKESKDRAINQYNVEVGDLEEGINSFEFYIQMNMLNVLEGNYECVISKIKRNDSEINIFRLVNTTYNLKYWTSLEV